MKGGVKYNLSSPVFSAPDMIRVKWDSKKESF